MASLVLSRKLDSLYRCLNRVRDKCPDNVTTLENDPDLQDIVVLNLNRAVQLCVDMATHTLATCGFPVPETMGGAFQHMADTGLLDADIAERLRKAVGFRNIAVHGDDAINRTIVHAITTRHLDDFRHFAAAVLKAAENQPGNEA